VDNYTVAFMGIALVYALYSGWARLDPRWPLAAALLLFVGAAVLRIDGAQIGGNLLTAYGMVSILVSLALMLTEHVRRTGAVHSSEGAAPVSPQ
jgi:drug/metabolite transporter superfamily protein YnfA